MKVVQSKAHDRILAAIGVLALEAALGCALILGLTVDMPTRASEELKLFNFGLRPPPAAEKPRPQPKKSKRREGAASPPNLKAKPTEIVAPPTAVPPILPPLVTAAPKRDVGKAPSAGASNVRGPGTGSGGTGAGSGSGGAGDGEGDGETPPRWRSGRIKASDYPHAAMVGAAGTVSVVYTIEATGRVTHCKVQRSSGSASYDQRTCELIERRFRYEPARDERGQAVSTPGGLDDKGWSLEENDE